MPGDVRRKRKRLPTEAICGRASLSAQTLGAVAIAFPRRTTPLYHPLSASIIFLAAKFIGYSTGEWSPAQFLFELESARTDFLKFFRLLGRTHVCTLRNSTWSHENQTDRKS